MCAEVRETTGAEEKHHSNGADNRASTPVEQEPKSARCLVRHRTEKTTFLVTAFPNPRNGFLFLHTGTNQPPHYNYVLTWSLDTIILQLPHIPFLSTVI